ncbi:MAG TPA: hypothetical protein VKP14_04685 [Gaiellaceae bacterium]|nr:hypothetical protein [Gaiellaceae bacterium]
MKRKWIAGWAGATVVCLAAVVAAAGSASAAGGPPSIAAGPAFGFVPAQNANHGGGGQGHVSLLQWHNGPVMHSTTVIPVFWGSAWSSSSFTGDKVTGLDYLYSNIHGTSYAHTNSEYTDGAGNVNTTSIGKGSDFTDTSATPSGAPSTAQVLAEVAKETNNNPTAGAYYPVYSDQPRGSAGYCAWHSSGTINGVQVEFGFFFNLDGDPGCDPNAPTNLGHSQGLSALANVSGHELSEMLTDPQLNAWYDRQGNENADKCAWTFSGLVTIGAQSWKIQGNWSNAAASTNSGYANGGCIQTS